MIDRKSASAATRLNTTRSTLPDRSVAAILPAAGSGSRFGSSENKLFAILRGEPIWFHSARKLALRPEVARIIMPIAKKDRPAFEGRFAALVAELNIELVEGGADRTASVRSALDAIGDDSSIRFVAIHDAARPLVRDVDLAAVFTKSEQTGAAILGAPVSATLKRVFNNGKGSTTVDRAELFTALTPQVFRIDILRNAYARYRGRPATDDAELVERSGHPVAVVSGSSDNLKITLPEDLLIAEAILSLNMQFEKGV